MSKFSNGEIETALRAAISRSNIIASGGDRVNANFFADRRVFIDRPRSGQVPPRNLFVSLDVTLESDRIDYASDRGYREADEADDHLVLHRICSKVDAIAVQRHVNICMGEWVFAVQEAYATADSDALAA